MTCYRDSFSLKAFEVMPLNIILHVLGGTVDGMTGQH
jgi:hypothetical protein